ncbi:MAG: glycosyltransferase [Candidatus Cloacimonetes bacterium]|nr:glycosyltransferase [Candidatus Cloacimonadota bacterium]
MNRYCTCFLFVGRLTLQTRLDTILRTLAHVDGDWRLDVLGDGPQRHGLESLAGSLDLSERALFHGWVSGEEVIAAMQAADWLLLPSTVEGLSMACLQAGSLGLPVLSADTPRLRRFIEPGVTGLLVGEGVASWLDALNDVIAHPGQSAAMRQHSHETLHANDGLPTSLEMHLEVFQALAKKYSQSAS